MQTQSDPTILTQILGSYQEHDVFSAEQVIIEYIGSLPDTWGEVLSVAAAKLTKRLSRDDTISSETVDNHSVSFRARKDIEDILGQEVLALIASYKVIPASSSGSYILI